MERVLISLVITTYNRAALLAEALASVAASQIESPEDVEVIVVDNNSTDDTHQTVEGVRARGFPFELRYVFEQKQGISYARNRGAEESRATYVAFMDDDQLIEKNYLARLAPAFQSTGAICIGGPNLMRNDEALPGWLPPLLRLSRGQRNHGSDVKVLRPGDGMLIGGNMAFIRQELLDIGKYNVNLGRSGRIGGDALLSGEEDELQERLHAAGKKIVFHPGLIQHDPLAPVRRTKSFWRRHHFHYGRSLYRMRVADTGKYNGPSLLGAPRWLWRALFLDDIPKSVTPLARLDLTASFYRQLDVCTRLGQICEARHTGRQSKAR